MKKYGISEERYHFGVGDIFEEIKKISPNEIDVVFCFGIFYHVSNHMELLKEIKKLQPKYLILDTAWVLKNLQTDGFGESFLAVSHDPQIHRPVLHDRRLGLNNTNGKRRRLGHRHR